MSKTITINKRPSFGGEAIFTSESAASIKEAIAQMRSALKVGDRLNLQGADLRGADLQGAYLQGADLRGAYLRGAYLQGADLRGAYLRGAYLRGAYLQGAYLRDAQFGGGEEGIGLTPKSLGLPDAVPAFELAVIDAALTPGALEMDAWHTCETTHCLAGWAVHMAGAAGKLSERLTSPSCAGALLVPGLAHLFYMGNEEATEAIKARREELLKATEVTA